MKFFIDQNMTLVKIYTTSYEILQYLDEYFDEIEC